jgi:hypothetical protein
LDDELNGLNAGQTRTNQVNENRVPLAVGTSGTGKFSIRKTKISVPRRRRHRVGSIADDDINRAIHRTLRVSVNGHKIVKGG